jgi:GntR family transcriptional regulator/MocR family aminotransferase
LRRLRRDLAERREMLVDALAAAGYVVVGDEAGAHVVVLLDSAQQEEAVVLAGRKRGLWLDGLARHHAGKPRWFGLAIGYAACTRDELVSALPVLVEVLRPSVAPLLRR